MKRQLRLLIYISLLSLLFVTQALLFMYGFVIF